MFIGHPATGFAAKRIAPRVSLFVAGVATYLAVTRSRDKTGSIALWSLVVFLLLIYTANFTSPPPPSVQVIAYVGLLQILFPLWAWWIDRHRPVR